jgi:hypothetical protein
MQNAVCAFTSFRTRDGRARARGFVRELFERDDMDRTKKRKAQVTWRCVSRCLALSHRVCWFGSVFDCEHSAMSTMYTHIDYSAIHKVQYSRPNRCTMNKLVRELLKFAGLLSD